MVRPGIAVLMMRKTCVFRAKNSAGVYHIVVVSTSVSADERDAG